MAVTVVCSKTPFIKKSHHFETDQFICKLAGFFYMIPVLPKGISEKTIEQILHNDMLISKIKVILGGFWVPEFAILR